jgi:hypothetical protein
VVRLRSEMSVLRSERRMAERPVEVDRRASATAERPAPLHVADLPPAADDR